MHPRWRRLIIEGVLIGVAAAVGLHSWTHWWLNSSRGVRVTLPALFALSLVLAAMPRGRTLYEVIISTGALWAGVMLGFTVILFVIGPGNIFPIVLAVASFLTAGAILAGGVIGGTLMVLLSRRRSSHSR